MKRAVKYANITIALMEQGKMAKMTPTTYNNRYTHCMNTYQRRAIDLDLGTAKDSAVQTSDQ